MILALIFNYQDQKRMRFFNQIIDIIYMKCFESFVDVDRHFRYDFEYASEDDQKYYQKVLRGHFRYFETLCKGIHFQKGRVL